MESASAGMTKAQTGMESASAAMTQGASAVTGQIVPGLNSAASALTDASTMLSSKAEGLGTAFGGMKAQISAVSSAMDTYGQTTTSTLNDANGRIDAAQQAMNSAVAELQAIQSAQDEDGKFPLKASAM